MRAISNGIKAERNIFFRKCLLVCQGLLASNVDCWGVIFNSLILCLVLYFYLRNSFCILVIMFINFAFVYCTVEVIGGPLENQHLLKGYSR